MSGCEFCFGVLVPLIAKSVHRDNCINFPGAPHSMARVSNIVWAYEMTCTYKPGAKSKCPQNVLRYKEAFLNEARKKGTSMPVQYYNTPACDGQPFLSNMFHSEVYGWMLRTKKVSGSQQDI